MRIVLRMLSTPYKYLIHQGLLSTVEGMCSFPKNYILGVDSTSMCVYLTTEEADKTKFACEGILSSPNPTICEVASLLG